MPKTIDRKFDISRFIITPAEIEAAFPSPKKRKTFFQLAMESLPKLKKLQKPTKKKTHYSQQIDEILYGKKPSRR